MIRIPILIISFFILCSPLGAANEIPSSAPESEGQNLTNITNNQTNTDNSNETSLSALNHTALDSNLTEGGQNTTNAEKKSEQPVYKQSIGSVYSADFTEPEGMTFTSSGCAA